MIQSDTKKIHRTELGKEITDETHTSYLLEISKGFEERRRRWPPESLTGERGRRGLRGRRGGWRGERTPENFSMGRNMQRGLPRPSWFDSAQLNVLN